MLYTSSKVYESPNSTKTRCKIYAWSARVPSNERRYRWVTSRSMMLWVSSLSLRSLMYSILRVSSFCRKKVASCKKISKLLMGNSSSRTRKNSPTGSTKADTLMLGGMFTITPMNYWGERFTKVRTGFGLLGIVPWCAMAAWKAMAMVMAVAWARLGIEMMPKILKECCSWTSNAS